MSSCNISQKFKGLINGNKWESGSLKFYKNDLTVIYRQETHFYVYKDSVSRFTGFINIYGEEIFEGDIVALPGTNESRVVVWDEVSQHWKISASPIQDPFFSSFLKNCLNESVIGHLFTHEYLLNSSKVKLHTQ